MGRIQLMENKKLPVVLIITVLGILALGAVILNGNNSINDNTTGDNIFNDNIITLLPADGIPSIDNPQYWDVTQANSYLANADIIFGFVHNGVPKAYPQRILVWHEIVNEDGSVSITYCPLTGSAIGYFGNFGTSGKLVNSNLVMYDRSTQALWPQILGRSVSGDAIGTKLDTFQLYITSWSEWRTQYPNTLVLSTVTGTVRNYNFDPYGSYAVQSSYYYQGGLQFGAIYSDVRLADKELVLGIDYNDEQVSIRKSYLKDNNVLNFDLEKSNLVAFYDNSLNVGRIYSRLVENETLSFTFENGEIIDNHGLKWNLDGTNDNNNNTLTKIVYFDVFWAAWVGFFPDAVLIF